MSAPSLATLRTRPRIAFLTSDAPVDALFDVGLDGVVVGASSEWHAQVAAQALERGIAVFCQDPPAWSVAQTQRVICAARDANRLLGVDLRYRYPNAMRAVRGVVRDGLIGDILAADLVFHRAYTADRAPAALGCVTDLGTHLVDLALWALEFPTVREVTLLTELDDHRAHDYTEAQLVLGSGIVVRIACSWRLALSNTSMIGASFHGSRGSAAFENVNGSPNDFIAERYEGEQRELLCGPPDDAWRGRALLSWASRIASGEPYDPAIERILDVVRTVDAMRASAARPKLVQGAAIP